MYIQKNIQSKFQKNGSDWINKISLFNRGLLVTYNLWDNLSWDKGFDTTRTISKLNRRFLRRLEKRCNVHQKQRLERLVVIEKDKPRNHVHMIVETPIHVSNECMTKHIVKSLKDTKGLGQLDLTKMRYKSGLIDYLTKELQTDIDSIDLENCYFKGR